MEKRRLGRTGHLSTVVTFGSAGIGRVEQDVADRAVQAALDYGVNHFDVAPSYGEAELRLGDYLRRHPQPDLFIGCKTNERGRAEARAELDRTLDRLGRDRFDLYQLHAVCNMEDLDACFAPGGSFASRLGSATTERCWRSPAPTQPTPDRSGRPVGSARRRRPSSGRSRGLRSCTGS